MRAILEEYRNERKARGGERLEIWMSAFEKVVTDLESILRNIATEHVTWDSTEAAGIQDCVEQLFRMGLRRGWLHNTSLKDVIQCISPRDIIKSEYEESEWIRTALKEGSLLGYADILVQDQLWLQFYDTNDSAFNSPGRQSILRDLLKPISLLQFVDALQLQDGLKAPPNSPPILTRLQEEDVASLENNDDWNQSQVILQQEGLVGLPRDAVALSETASMTPVRFDAIQGTPLIRQLSDFNLKTDEKKLFLKVTEPFDENKPSEREEIKDLIQEKPTDEPENQLNETVGPTRPDQPINENEEQIVKDETRSSEIEESQIAETDEPSQNNSKIGEEAMDDGPENLLEKIDKLGEENGILVEKEVETIGGEDEGQEIGADKNIDGETEGDKIINELCEEEEFFQSEQEKVNSDSSLNNVEIEEKEFFVETEQQEEAFANMENRNLLSKSYENLKNSKNDEIGAEQEERIVPTVDDIQKKEPLIDLEEDDSLNEASLEQTDVSDFGKEPAQISMETEEFHDPVDEEEPRLENRPSIQAPFDPKKVQKTMLEELKEKLSKMIGRKQINKQ